MLEKVEKEYMSNKSKIKYNDEKHRKLREYNKKYYKETLKSSKILYPTKGYTSIKNRWYEFLCAILQTETNKLIV